MLLTSSERIDGRRFQLIEWEGKSIRVWDDAATALRLIELFGDEEVDLGARAEISLRLLFVNPEGVLENIKDVSGLLMKALQEVAGFTKTATGKSVLDWIEDAPYVKASVQMTYGVSLDELAKQINYEELCSMVALCPHETPIGQALYYRTAKPPKATKHNHAEVEDFRKKKRFWALKTKAGAKPKKKDHYAEMSDQATSAAAALRRARR